MENRKKDVCLMDDSSKTKEEIKALIDAMFNTNEDESKAEDSGK